ncbi:MAG: hypothetical protein ACOY37_12905 [Pseudomonadota bacterium]
MDAGEQLAQVEGFGEEIVGAQFQADRALRAVAAAADDLFC